MNRHIDHIVYAVPDLEAAMQDFEAKTAVRPVFGGYHQTQGTKNALVNLGDECYLEFLAADISNTAIAPPRWMGVDSIQNAQVTRWALKSEHLIHDSQVLQTYRIGMGQIQAGQRKMNNDKLLTWQMTMPLTEPTVEIIPFFLDWRQSETHPTTQLKMECNLLSIDLTHPSPELIEPIFKQLRIDKTIHKANSSKITIRLATPRGIITI